MAVDEGARRCRSNDGAAAVGSCRACGEAVCAGCIARRDGSAITCRICAYAAALSGVAREEGRRRATAERAAAQAKEDPARGRRAAGWLGLGAAVVALVAAMVPALLWTADPSVRRAPGETGSDAPGLAECVAGLWRVREAMDAYLAGSGGLAPDSLSRLPGAPAACPGCGGPWRYRHAASDYEVACPDPARHGRAAVLLDPHTGPPQVLENRPRAR